MYAAVQLCRSPSPAAAQVSGSDPTVMHGVSLDLENPVEKNGEVRGGDGGDKTGAAGNGDWIASKGDVFGETGAFSGAGTGCCAIRIIRGLKLS